MKSMKCYIINIDSEVLSIFCKDFDEEKVEETIRNYGRIRDDKYLCFFDELQGWRDYKISNDEIDAIASEDGSYCIKELLLKENKIIKRDIKIKIPLSELESGKKYFYDIIRYRRTVEKLKKIKALRKNIVFPFHRKDERIEIIYKLGHFSDLIKVGEIGNIILITRIDPSNQEILCPKEYIGAVIGRNGDNIKNKEKILGMKIKVIPISSPRKTKKVDWGGGYFKDTSLGEIDNYEKVRYKVMTVSRGGGQGTTIYGYDDDYDPAE